jgi:hypothetical protein
MKQNKFLRGVAVYLALSILFEIAYPTAAMALTGGPAQPETSSFEPIGTSEMVDLFSGDFNYNIPLMDVGGYPINISYHSGISMDQEASWVGLGWNINAGAINRNMRGLPDDFKGDEITKEFNIKPNRTFGANVGFGAAIAGFDNISLNFSIGAKYNNYTGVGFEESASIAISTGESGKGKGTASLGLHSSADGLDISPSVSFSKSMENKDGSDTKFGASVGTSFNSRAGLKALSVNTSVEQSRKGELKQKMDPKTKEVIKEQSMSASSVGTGCSIGFTNSTYVPSINMPMKNAAVNSNFQLGGTVFTFDGTLNCSGYYSEQKLSESKQVVPAYGYMFSEEALNLDKVLLDFNREKDGGFTRTTPALPLTNYSYDLFSVSGQGVGGMFRPFRGDVGYVFDSRNNTTSDSYSLGVELALGNLAHGGADVTLNDVNTTTGKWTDNNKAAEVLQARKTVTGLPTYESYFFKEVGEKNTDANPNLYAALGGAEPVRVSLQDDGYYEVRAKNYFDVGTNATGTLPIPTTNYRDVRQKRNQLFSIVSKGDYSTSALDATTLSSQINSNAKPSHIGEITTTKTDGTRYVYGLPAYNTKQREVTFSMGGYTEDLINNVKIDGVIYPTGVKAGTVTYNPSNNDNKKTNKNGIDNYFSSTELPAYAHSYLLTAVLSADYVDLTGNGCTPDDYGTYTKFKYTNPLAGGTIYNWRVPYGLNKANFNEGLKTGDLDEQGNYIYGEKEVWMLDAIETKNYIAIFTKKGRADGFDVAGENGGIGDNTTPLLKTISLYTRPDYYLPNGSVNPSRIAIKEVHFTYDYSLCLKTLNNVSHPDNGPVGTKWLIDTQCEESNAGGKLTLKSIYFTYGNSNKAKLNPYKFDYMAALGNPDYGMKDYDRWGNYKPNDPTNAIPNSEFPYVNQSDQTKADRYASAWSLSRITLPSGGMIDMTYQSDDYAYVQNKRAMQMIQITGIGSATTIPATGAPAVTGNILSSNVGNGADENNSDYIYFKLPTPVPRGTNKSQLYSDYLEGITDFYFRCFISINSRGSDYISGYADNLLDYDYAGDDGTNYQYAYIRFRRVTVDDIGKRVNPITKAALQFARINTPRQAYSNPYNPDPDKVSIESVVKALADADMMKNIIQTFQGANGTLFEKYLGRPITLAKSSLRLLNPTKKKFGGGSRVSRITITDDWGTMANNALKTFSYGQDYVYETTENGKIISSGVAAYEPLTGGDENPFRLPVAFSQKLKLAADYDYYQEEPYGESFFPSASVGYSKVTVKNLARTNVTRHATGYVVNEFYTSRDYPTITDRTPVDARAKKSGALLSLLSLKVKDFMTASQGFVIDLNNMSGQVKATKVYAEGQKDFISGVEYKYKSIGNKLDNSAVVINKDGSIQNGQIGVDYDFIADMREQRTDVVNAGLQINLYGFLAGIVPLVIPPIIPTLTSEETRFRSATTTKIINRFGLLEETIAYDLGSKVCTKNLSYDAETGEVALTKVQNEFNDDIYKLNFSAHLAYNRMGAGYKNVGTVLSSTNGLSFNGSGKITDPTGILVPGDEIQLTPVSPATLPAGKRRFWIMMDKASPDLYAIDEQGTAVPFNGSYVLRIVRSGRRNQQTMPIGSFVSLRNPINKNNGTTNDSQLATFDESYQIITASANKYSEIWRTFCECGIVPSSPGNPYIRGTLGNWRMKRGYAFLSDRTQTRFNGNANIRVDGPFNFFRQFWSSNGGSDWTVPTDLKAADPHWTWTSEITEYSPYGPELENRDALNRYSAAIYGYNNTLPLSVGSNTKYKQIAFDNFEDYDFDDCPQDHFSFEPFVGFSGITISNAESHSGKRSIMVPAGGNVEITKIIDPCVVGGTDRE